MILCEVLGTVVATAKDPGFRGSKLMLVQRWLPDGTRTGEIFVATDSVGSGTGEIVLVTQGAPAMRTDITKDAPTDATIIGIVDQIEAEGGELGGGRRFAIDTRR